MKLTEDQAARIRTAAGSTYDGDAARPPITPGQVAEVVLRAHHDIARCYCPTCVLAREVERLAAAEAELAEARREIAELSDPDGDMAHEARAQAMEP